MKICVFGAASASIDKKYVEAVENLGRYMAQRGHELVFGAGDNGLMGAAARGVKNGGGRIVGVIPKFFKEENVEGIYEYCDELIYTDSMRERKCIMEDRADAFIIVPGGIGTFEEFYEVLTLKQLCRHNKPIVIYNVNGFYDDLLKFMQRAVSEHFIKKSCVELYRCTENAEQAVEFAEEVSLKDFSVKDLKEG